MRPPVKLRSVTAEEEKALRKLVKAQNAAVKLVRRAQIIVNMLDDETVLATDAGIAAGLSNAVGAKWVRRFNEEGVAGLADRARSGRKAIYDEEVRSRLVSLALQKPQELSYPFALWTLERLQTAFEEREGYHIAQSTILAWMAAEGFAWKRQQSWFEEVEKHDPEFVEKRGPSSGLTSNHRLIRA